MPVTFVTGDLFDAPDLPALAHGCNCAGAMGKGIALEFKKRFPSMYEEYRARCQAGTFGLGDVFVWVDPAKVVFNLGTQRTWRTRAELEAIDRAVERMLEIGESMKIARIGLPRIGAGLGGLDWAKVRDVLERRGAETSIELVVFERFEPPSSARGAGP